MFAVKPPPCPFTFVAYMRTRLPHFALGMRPSIRLSSRSPTLAGSISSCRYASSSSANPYPYPPHANPTPHQIFHLPPNASTEDVKARYYDLVRIYHPDSPVNRSLPPATVQARFQAIGTAYDVLRGRSRILPSGDTERVDTRKKDFHDLSTAMWRAKQRKKADLSLGTGVISDKWKDRLMMGAIIFTIGAFVAQIYATRRQNMSSALKDYSQTRSDYYDTRTPSSSRAPSTRTDDSALGNGGPSNKLP